MARPSEGVFSGLGGDIVIKVDIVPKPEQIKSQLMMTAHNLEDTMKPMLAARRIAQEDIQAHFDSESTPAGEHWVALDVDYFRYKESTGGDPRILRKTGELEKTAVSDEAFIVTAHGLWYNWDALPKVEWDDSEGGEGNLGIIHQVGTAGGNVVRVADIREGHEGETLSYGAVGAGRGKALPARPFVGMSDFMAASFEEVFNVWFDEATSVVINPKTGVMQYMTSRGFGRRVV